MCADWERPTGGAEYFTGDAGRGIEDEAGVRTTGELTALIVPDTLLAPLLVLILALELTLAFGRKSPLFAVFDL